MKRGKTPVGAQGLRPNIIHDSNGNAIYWFIGFLGTVLFLLKLYFRLLFKLFVLYLVFMTQALTSIPISKVISTPLILDDISWEKYEQLLDIFAEYPAIRMTYDQGKLEIITPLPEHERSSWTLGRLIVILSEELDLEIIGLKSTTWTSKLKAVGKEADECFYIQNEAKMRGKVKIDLAVDPPPDLVIEIDLTHSFIDKMSIYNKLKVPEVWQYQNGKITIYLLNQDQGQYQESETSLAFSLFPVKQLANFVKIDDQKGENAKMKEFRQWVRLQLSK